VHDLRVVGEVRRVRRELVEQVDVLGAARGLEVAALGEPFDDRDAVDEDAVLEQATASPRTILRCAST
jgi:hypothetical protein